MNIVSDLKQNQIFLCFIHVNGLDTARGKLIIAQKALIVSVCMIWLDSSFFTGHLPLVMSLFTGLKLLFVLALPFQTQA